MPVSGPTTKDTSSVALGLAQIRVGKSASHIGQIAPVLVSADSMGAMASTKFSGSVEYWKLESGFPLKEDMSIPIKEASSLECSFKELTSKNLALSRGLDPFADIAAAIVGGESNTTAGTMTGVITADNTGTTTDVFTVVFTSATALSIFGTKAGHIGDFTDLAAAIAPDNSGNPYFTIPANFFSGTWANDDTYFFASTAFVAGTAAFANNHAGEIKLGAMKAPEFMRLEAVYTYPNNTNFMHIIFPRANATSSMEIDLQAEDNANVSIVWEAKRADEEVDGGNSVWNAMSLGRIVFT